MSSSAKKQKGLILVYILVLVLTLAGIAGVLTANHLSDVQFFKDYEYEKKAYWLALGGIELGMDALRKDASVRGALPPVELNGGKISVTLSLPVRGKFVILSLGEYRGVVMQATRELSVLPDGKILFSEPKNIAS